MLSDELYWGSNHAGLLASDYQRHDATLVVRPDSTAEEIGKNFAVFVDGRSVRRVVEKPADRGEGVLGCGTYIFSRRIFEFIDRRLAWGSPQSGDLTGAIGDLIDSGAPVQHYAIAGGYVNINCKEDLDRARSLVRRPALNVAPEARQTIG
jgi:NDP-sugar pyrophosphorylase family protein